MVDPPTVPVQWLWKRRPDHVGDLAILTDFVRPEPQSDVFTATVYV